MSTRDARERYRDIADRGCRRVARFVIRHLEDDVVDKLKRRATQHARGMEDDVRHILRSAVQDGPAKFRELGSRIARRFQRAGLTSDLPEWRGRAASPISAIP